MDSTETFFTKLKKIRESKDISIKEIAESTKINTKFLSAIESGNFDVLPTVYMRLFIRSYCEFLEIDPKKVLDDYEIFTVGSLKDKSINIPETKNTFDDILDENNIDVGQIPKSRIIKIVITLIVIISFFWFVSSITNNTDDIPTTNDLNQNTKIEPEYIDGNDEIIDVENEISDTIQETIPILVQEQTEAHDSDSKPYNKDNFIKEFSTELPLSGPPPFTLAIETLKETSIHVSMDNYTNSYEKKVKAGEHVQIPFSEDVNFDLINASDVKCSLNDISIDEYLENNNNYLIRASYETENPDNNKSRLFISFYKNNS